MPIKEENKKLYPKNWKEIRQKITKETLPTADTEGSVCMCCYLFCSVDYDVEIC